MAAFEKVGLHREFLQSYKAKGKKNDKLTAGVKEEEGKYRKKQAQK